MVSLDPILNVNRSFFIMLSSLAIKCRKTVSSILFPVLFLSISAQAVDSEEIIKTSAEFISLARSSAPFRMFGHDQLGLKIVMAAAFEKKTIDIAHLQKMYADTVSKVTVEKMEFESFDDYLEKEKASWPASGDVLTDIQRIQEKGMSIIEPIFKNEIDKKTWEMNQANQAEFVKKVGIAGLGTTLLVANQSPEELEKMKTQLRKFTASFDNFEGRLQNSFKDMFASEGDGFLKAVFPILMTEYLQNVNLRTKMNIMAGLFEGSFPFTKDGLVMGLFANAGPQLQKMVQTLGRNKSLEPKWQQLFQTFESNVRPVPFWQVEQILSRAVFPFEIIEFNIEPLGVGTVAQTHLGKVKLKNGDIVERVFRFIKPGMKEKSLEEADVIKNACMVIDAHPDVVGKNFPKLTSLADNSYEMIKEDMVLSASAKNQMIGRKVYTRSDIEVPEVWLSLDPEQLVMYQTKGEGRKISKFTHYVQKKSLNRLVEVWLEEALFRSGYFHADLHQGNSMVKLRTKVSGHDRQKKTIIDFGMFKRLTKEDRVNLMGFGIAVRLNDPKTLAQIAWRLSDLRENQITVDELQIKIQEKLKTKNGDGFTVPELIKFFPEVGIELNANVLSYLRGSITLGDQLMEVDPKMGLLNIATKVALKHPFQVLKVLNLKEINMMTLLKVAWLQFISSKLFKPKTVESSVMCLRVYQ
jgi:predicted unusual protein kinase regulating ubiquinone biosynthesis (AarF/ABC1/UbiB family)